MPDWSRLSCWEGPSCQMTSNAPSRYVLNYCVDPNGIFTEVIKRRRSGGFCLTTTGEGVREWTGQGACSSEYYVAVTLTNRATNSPRHWRSGPLKEEDAIESRNIIISVSNSLQPISCEGRRLETIMLPSFSHDKLQIPR